MLPSPVPSSVDLQAFGDLRRRAASDDPAALAEAAAQFEALFIGMMLKSARDAKLGDGLLDGAQTQQYLELMDQQVALDLARGGGLGLGKTILEQLQRAAGESPAVHAPPAAALAEPAAPPRLGAAAGAFPARLPESLEWLAAGAGAPGGRGAEEARAVEAARHDTPERFVARFLPDATAAAAKLGIEPKLLLAQAALETGWGSAMPRHPDGTPTHNLFGIKAGPSWDGERAAHWTLESIDGVTQRKREVFRAYPSSTASFADYVDLVASNPRYAAALERAGDSAGYVRAITAAGYATDPSYGEKWLSIYNGERLSKAFGALKHGPLQPTQ
jgi:flagellar protein FlgJ